ncbi:MAG: type II toxin-antitoxin system RelE/ParE family toxin [Kiritimatiellae bacterium]|nr:type II toxin-antitoxin system RelE/ParE family toxin [Kiritimatiellia bacterium]
MKVAWSDNALIRLHGHVRYIAENSDRETASRWLERLEGTIGLIETFPSLFPLSSIRRLATVGIHEIVFENYRVFYIVREDECRIISILHCRQNVQSVSDI